MSRAKKSKRVKTTKNKFIILLLTLAFFATVFYELESTSMKYYSEITAEAKGFAKETRSDSYIVKFFSNGGEGSMEDQSIKYNESTKLSPNTFTKENYTFGGWNTKEDGTGTSYPDDGEILNLTEEIINLYAQWVQGIAEVNGTYYFSLQEAVDAVKANNVETTVKLLSNTSENIIIPKNKNIVFNLQNYTLSDPGTGAVITNNGTLKITNGTIKSNSVSAATINNNANAKLVITGGNILMVASGGKQALYNDKGTIEISGTAYLSSVSSIRAAVQNQASSTLKVTGGTILSTNFSGLVNNGTMDIGIKDNNVNRTSPVIQGSTYGIDSSTIYNFYDGIAKGKKAGINDETSINEKEDGYEIVNSNETINGKIYKTAYLDYGVLVTFNANEGTCSEATRRVAYGEKIGILPTPIRSGYLFDGWFTSLDGEEEIDSNTIITDNVTFFAHWTRIKVAQINETQYYSLQEAIDDVPKNNTETTVKLLADISENLTISDNQNIVFDLQDYTISYTGRNAAIENNGTLKISNGTITSNGESATIDNNSTGKLTISGGRIMATGTRQALYNLAGGVVEITGDAYLSSKSSGKPTASNLKRATIQNLTGGIMTITGGTIIGSLQQAISNDGLLTVGTKGDGNINTSSPNIRGGTCAMESTGTLNYYDGIFKGITDTIIGTVDDQEDNTQIADSTEQIDGKTYITAYLETIM